MFLKRQAHDILFDKEDGDAAGSDEEQKNIETRNGTRKVLRDAFQSVQVWCLPSPHAKIDGEGLMKVGDTLGGRARSHLLPVLRADNESEQRWGFEVIRYPRFDRCLVIWPGDMTAENKVSTW